MRIYFSIIGAQSGSPPLMDFSDFIIVELGAGMFLLAGARTGGGHDGLMRTLRQRGNVSDLSTLEQSEAVHYVEVLSAKEQKALYGVQALYSGTAEHVADLKEQQHIILVWTGLSQQLV